MRRLVTDSMDMNLSKHREMVKDREAGMLQSKELDITEQLNSKMLVMSLLIIVK